VAAMLAGNLPCFSKGSMSTASLSQGQSIKQL
jgi:hypothetical protein